ncbi:MAG: hypothetical protein U0103_10585 [Candidatus Obscuribacterales bacterium]
MPTQTPTPVLKSQSYVASAPSQGGTDLESIKLLLAAFFLAVLACLIAVGISNAICIHFSPTSELNQAVAK